MYTTTFNFVGVYPELFLVFIISLLIIYFVISDYYAQYRLILIKPAGVLTLLSLSFLLVLTLNEKALSWLTFKTLLINTPSETYVRGSLILFCLLLTFLAIYYLSAEKNFQYEFFFLFLLSLLGLFLLVTAHDLISMYLAIELQSLCFYILATFKQYTNFSTEAGIKYFILGAFSSGMLLFGSSIIYGFTGLTDFYGIQLLLQNSDLSVSSAQGALLGAIFIITGLLFKIGAAPFHMWTPDVYEGAPTAVTAFFAIIPKLALFSLLSKLFLTLFNAYLYQFDQILFVSSCLSLIIGSLGALAQIKLKRLLAYSGIAHVGFMLLGLSLFSIEGFYALFFYLLVYMVLSTTIFFILIVLRSNNQLKIKTINELVLLFKSQPSLAVILAVTLFSIAGIPPLLGFYSKLYIFVAGLQTNYYLPIIIAAVVSVVSALYYIRLVKLMFFKQTPYISYFQAVPLSYSLIISFTLLINIFFFIAPDLIVVFLHNLAIEFFI